MELYFAAKRRLLGPHRSRRTRLYGLGMGKTGTHSLAGMFSRRVRCAHEPERLELAEKILARQEGHISEEEFTRWVLGRDRRLALEVDSSMLNIDLLDILLREFPDARFVLTLRDCYSWCNSMMNEVLRSVGKVDPVLLRVRVARYRPHLFEYAPAEQVLKDQGLYTLAGYFTYWVRHNQQVLDKVPRERLLVVRTHEIGEQAFAIADFAGLPRRHVRLHRTHEYRNPAKQEIIRQIDQDFLEATVEQHCRPLMTRFFPEIKSLDDAKV